MTKLEKKKSLRKRIKLVLGVFALVWVATLLADLFKDVTLLDREFPVVVYKGPFLEPDIRFEKKKPGQWASYSQISRMAIGAVIVSEDSTFFRNDGFDLEEMKHAIKKDIEKRSFARGASTLTQQVVKNVFLTRRKSLWRKVAELVLAIRLDDRVSKKKILEVYFNVAEWGEGVYGIRAAAKKYFGKSPAELQPREAAYLAVLLPSPVRYSKASFHKRRLTPYLRKRMATVMARMVAAGYMSNETRVAAMSQPLSFE